MAVVAPRIHAMLDGRMSARGAPSLRERLHLRSRHALYAVMNPSKPVVANVVYFPGCGSERLYPEISIAALALLHLAGVKTFVPPAFTCCGYPFQANGLSGRASLRSFENRVVFHRMADSIGSSEIDAVLVSCGTCYEMLESYDLGKVFRNAPLLDINEFLALRKLIDRPETGDGRLLYHEPCHTPLRTLGYEATIEALLGTRPHLVPECCGDAGTLALSRPDISCVLRRRKLGEFPAQRSPERTTVVTTCPSCVAGLSKLRVGKPVAGRSLVVEVAERTLGEGWEEEFIRTLRTGRPGENTDVKSSTSERPSHEEARSEAPLETALCAVPAQSRDRPRAGVHFPHARRDPCCGRSPASSRSFQEAIGALYGAAYTLKFMSRLRTREPHRLSGHGSGRAVVDRFRAVRDRPAERTLALAIDDHAARPHHHPMLRQAIARLIEKKPGPALPLLRLAKFREGLVVQMMHIGPYAEEPRTVEIMKTAAAAAGYRVSGTHHEIYLGDPRRAKPEKLRTVLRYSVQKV